MQDEWLTLAEAAERLGISVQTARRWARDGKLHAERRGGPVGAEFRVRADELPARPEPPPPAGDVRAMAEALEALREEVRDATQKQALREDGLRADLIRARRELAEARAELDQKRGELDAANEALRQARETIADLHRQLEDASRLLERRTRALSQARRTVDERETGRLSVLRESLEESRRPWWRKLKPPEKK